jgi:5-(carboxyamino)imidazole ribonucleotide mutase
MHRVAILLGSKSDLPQAEKCRKLLENFGIQGTIHVASAHRTPERVDRLARDPSFEIFIAMAGLSAALPGAVAARTLRPVIGVPLNSGLGLDSLLSTVQMPRGVPVATVALDGAENAALLAVEILALHDAELSERLRKYREAWGQEPEQPTPSGGSVGA